MGKSRIGNQPPKNMIEVKAAIRIILAYSAKKNKAKAIPEYSTIWPATISDSPIVTGKQIGRAHV